MVQEGLGCAVTIDGLVKMRGTGVVFRPFEPRIRADLIFAWKKLSAFSEPAKAFLHSLQTIVEETES